VLGIVGGVLHAMRQRGEDFMPMLLVADDPSAPPTLVPFIDTADADARADVLLAVVASWPLRPARRVMFVSDAFIRVYFDEEPVDGRGIVAPGDDPQASEALMVLYAERADGAPRLWAGSFLYRFNDEGRFEWREHPRPEGPWVEVEGQVSRMQVAVMGATIGDDELVAEALRRRSS
jgi:hypothetical protein